MSGRANWCKLVSSTKVMFKKFHKNYVIFNFYNNMPYVYIYIYIYIYNLYVVTISMWHHCKIMLCYTTHARRG